MVVVKEIPKIVGFYGEQTNQKNEDNPGRSELEGTPFGLIFSEVG